MVHIQQLKSEDGTRFLLNILNGNSQFVFIGLFNEERQDIVGRQCFQEFMERLHGDADGDGLRACILFEILRVEFQVNQAQFTRVHGGGFDTFGRYGKTLLKHNILQTLNQRFHDTALQRADEYVTVLFLGDAHCSFRNKKIMDFFSMAHHKMLRINELNAKDKARAQENHMTYKMLYEKCANHIRRRHALGHRTTTWMVDGIVIGRPVYTYEHALRYIVEKLRKGGFSAYIDRETYEIVISWETKKRGGSKHRASSSSTTTGDARKKKVSNDIVNAWLHDTPIKKKSKSSKPSTNDPLSVRLKRLNAKISID